MTVFLCKTTILVRHKIFQPHSLMHTSVVLPPVACCQPEITETGLGKRIPSLLESGAIFWQCILTVLCFQFGVTTPTLRQRSIIVTRFHNYINVERLQYSQTLCKHKLWWSTFCSTDFQIMAVLEMTHRKDWRFNCGCHSLLEFTLLHLHIWKSGSFLKRTKVYSWKWESTFHALASPERLKFYIFIPQMQLIILSIFSDFS